MPPTPPGPPPVSKNPLALLRYARAFRDNPIEFVGQRFRTYGDLYATSFRGVPLFVTRHPEHIQEVLVTRGASFLKPEVGIAARQLQRLLGRGLLNSNGEFWRRQRRMINPAFGRKQIEELGAVMVEKTARMLTRWTPGESRDVAVDMMALTLDIVARTLFDHDPTGERDRIAGALLAFRDLSSVSALLPAWVPLPSVQRTRRALQDMDDIVYGLIDARRAEPDATLRSRPDLLSALVQAQLEGDEGSVRMTRTELRDEILTLFLAGHETTSQALTWTWYLLSQHPEVEARLHDELATVLRGRPPTAADALPYTDQVLQESMRLYPPVTTVGRVAAEDTEVGGYPVPRGSDVACWIYHAQRDPRWWDEPERFDPERFSPARLKQIPAGAYAPFGAGQRQCIGKHFALMEARLALATIAQRYALRLVPGHRVEPLVAITMSPRHGMRMTLRAR